MHLADWLARSEQLLKKSSISTARLDSELLAADVLGKDRSWLHAYPEHELTSKQVSELDTKITRRLQHEPIAYIRGMQEFYGRDFLVSPDTLTPRPETETMLDMLIQLLKSKKLDSNDKQLQIIDVGTGSGCIIITAALELTKIEHLTPNISYVGLDISEPALKIAKRNAKKYNVNVTFNKFDLSQDSLSKILDLKSCVLLANLPYVPDDFHINLAATHEPPYAIFGGHDGLDYYRQLFRQLQKHRSGTPHPLFVVTESLPPQHSDLLAIAQEAGFTCYAESDFIQIFETSVVAR